MSFSALYAQLSPTCVESNTKIKGVIWMKTFKIKENDYFGNVIIRPKDVTPEFLISLSRLLKKKYCSADSMVINIYDNKNSLNHGWEIYNRNENEVRERAIYTLDKKSNQEFIKYSTKLGLPLSQTIDLASPKRQSEPEKESEKDGAWPTILRF